LVPDDAEAEVVRQLYRWLVDDALTSYGVQQRVRTVLRSSYSGYYRRLLPKLLAALDFRGNNTAYRPVLDALGLLRRYVGEPARFYGRGVRVPLADVVPAAWREAVVDERGRAERIPYELCVLTALREALQTYLATLPAGTPCLFPSRKRAGPTATAGHGPTALTERALSYLVAKVAARARVADVTAHDLRHRFGYRMARTVPLHRLAQIMGHDSLDTTLLYVRGTQQDLQQAVEAIAWT
jgi:integrase